MDYIYSSNFLGGPHPVAGAVFFINALCMLSLETISNLYPVALNPTPCIKKRTLYIYIHIYICPSSLLTLNPKPYMQP